MKLNKSCRPENYRLLLQWEDQGSKEEFDSGPTTVASVWRAMNFINEHNRSVSQGTPYTEIKAELWDETGSGPATLEQVEALGKIADIQNSLENLYIECGSNDRKLRQSTLYRPLKDEQDALIKGLTSKK